MRKSDGGPAFPRVGYDTPSDGWVYGERGMSLRDYFAAHYLGGMTPWQWDWDKPEKNQPAEEYLANVAKSAYAMADAMLRARDEERDDAE